MNSLARAPRVIRSAMADDDIVVIGGMVQRAALPGVGPVATAHEIVAAAEARAAELLAAAELRAAELIARANTHAAETVAAAREEGIQHGMAQAQAEAESLLAVLRSAAVDGAAIRDQIAAEASGVITRAVLIAVRRIVGEIYSDDPARTSAAVADALRAASSQEVVAIRVNPAVEPAVKAALVDVAAYIRPDDAVEIGGCLIDLRNGSIDASLDTRLSLMELAITSASGEVTQ